MGGSGVNIPFIYMNVSLRVLRNITRVADPECKFAFADDNCGYLRTKKKDYERIIEHVYMQLPCLWSIFDKQTN